MNEYDEIIEKKGLFSYVRLNGKWGLINSQKKEIIPCQYDFMDKAGLYPFSDLLWVKSEGKTGVISWITGEEIIPCQYDFIDELSAQPVKVSVNGKFGYLESVLQYWEENGIKTLGIQKPKEIIAPKYENATHFAGNAAAVQLNGKWGSIDVLGNTLTPFIDDENPLQEMCKQGEHLYKYSRCLIEGSNMDVVEYECSICKHTKIERDFHWSQD